MGGFAGQVDATGDSGGTHHQHLGRATTRGATHRATAR